MEITTEETQITYPYIVSVKFKNGNKAYTFGTFDETIQQNDIVVVETIRGAELGEVTTPLKEACSSKCPKVIKPILRKASQKDISDYDENIELSKVAFTTCQKLIADFKLDMNLISAEYTLDRSKILFVYVADERVDFRELLKHLANSLHCRIELRQIGSRDKAKIVGGLGTCGMETCCSRFMKEFEIVSINMAKNQLLALNIQKISGQCGKLMCCLKFEDDVYQELRAGLPKMNSQIDYEGATYRLTAMNVISNVAKLENKELVQYVSLEDLKNKGTVKKGDATTPKKKEA